MPLGRQRARLVPRGDGRAPAACADLGRHTATCTHAPGAPPRRARRDTGFSPHAAPARGCSAQASPLENFYVCLSQNANGRQGARPQWSLCGALARGVQPPPGRTGSRCLGLPFVLTEGGRTLPAADRPESRIGGAPQSASGSSPPGPAVRMGRPGDSGRFLLSLLSTSL